MTFHCLPQIVDCIIRRVDDPVSQLFNFDESRPLISYAVYEGGCPTCERVRPPRLAETAHEGLIGSIEKNKRADLILVNLESLHTIPHSDPVSAVVFSAQPSDVDAVIINGKIAMRERQLMTLDRDSVIRDAQSNLPLPAETQS